MTLLGPHLQAISGRRNDSQVGLMRDECIDIAARQAVSFENLVAEFRHLTNGELEDRAAVLMDVVHFLIDGVMSRRIQAPAAWHVERTSPGAVDLVNEVNQALPNHFPQVRE